MTIERFLRAFCFTCSILFFCVPLELHAQSEGKEYDAGFQCSIEIETATWSQGEPIFVIVQVKNVSDKEINILGIYSFELSNVNDIDAIKRNLPRSVYWGPVNILSGAPLKLQFENEGQMKGIVGGKAPEGAIHLGARETKTMKFDLTKLLWNKSYSSVWPYQKLIEVVPGGNYELIFRVEIDRRKDSDNNLIVTHIVSNQVRIVVE